MPKDLRTPSSTALQIGRQALKGAARVAVLSPFPQVKAIFDMANAILDVVEVSDLTS